MYCYRPAGQELHFPGPFPELEGFASLGSAPAPAAPAVPAPGALTSRTQGWVAGELRDVEAWSASPGVQLKVSGVGDFHVTPQGIQRLGGTADRPLTGLERETILGPALVLALAFHETWCLHASAALFDGQVTAFLGESGQGKSTLAAHLSEADWRLVADDILPVARDQAGVQAWPHFPQLKLKVQPGASLAERLPLSRICVLAQADVPEISRLSSGEALQALLRHTAGTRLFDPPLLAKHMAFCAWAAARVPVFSLAYPRRWESLPKVKELLENPC